LITVDIYKNGYEIKGHAIQSSCYQISFWHWITSNLLIGLDKSAKEYASERDNKENSHEGYSWAVFTPNYKDLNWIFDDLVISMEKWVNDEDIIPKGDIVVNHIDGILDK